MLSTITSTFEKVAPCRAGAPRVFGCRARNTGGIIEVRRIAMSCRSKSVGKRALSGILLSLVLVIVVAGAQAQDQPTPKADVFVGYQWLNPGATVPAPFNPSSAPVPFQLKDMAKGFGGAVAYNFDRHFALEVDLGHNWGDQGYELN